MTRSQEELLLLRAIALFRSVMPRQRGKTTKCFQKHKMTLRKWLAKYDKQTKLGDMRGRSKGFDGWTPLSIRRFYYNRQRSVEAFYALPVYHHLPPGKSKTNNDHSNHTDDSDSAAKIIEEALSAMD